MKYIDTVEHIDYAAKEEEIKKTIDLLNEKNVAWQLLKEGLAKAEEKKVTKRVLYPLKEHGYTTHLERDPWSLTFHIWGNGIDYNNKMHISLGSDMMDDFCMEVFLKKYDYLETKLLPQIEGYEEILSNLVEYVVEFNLMADNFNAAKEGIEEVDKKFRPSVY
jgi:hypothetical protein